MMPDPWFISLCDLEVGEFILREYLGHGKIEYVYRATSKEIPDWEVALKLVPGKLKKGWANELKKVSRLSTITGVVHFHGLAVAKLTRSSRTEIFQYTVWDYIAPGRNLRKYLEQSPSCSASFLLALVEQILRVLH